jgi:hypothetical protein
MAKRYFKKKGFTGLSRKGKLIDVCIFIGVLLISWLIFYIILRNFAKPTPPNEIAGGISVFFASPLALFISWIAQFFLPRNTYFYTEYFCADCGQYLGYSPAVCTRCGCNRYTTEDTGVGRTIRNR